MRYIFCLETEEDIKKIQDGQIDKFITKNKLANHRFYLDKEESIKDQLLRNFKTADLDIDDDEYVIFVPANNILIEEPDHQSLYTLLKACKESDADYCKLRKTSIKSRASENVIYHKDEANIFSECPYLIKYKVLKEIISNSRFENWQMFWRSLETGGFSGLYYYNRAKDHRLDYSYIVPSVFHTISHVIMDNGMWSSSYINYNNNSLGSLIAEYNIDIEERQSGSYGFSEGCCGK